jgi:hypothetical protein
MQIIESTNTTSWWLRLHFPGLWGESRLFSAEYMRYRGNHISLFFSYLGSANADFRDLPSSQERLCILVQTRKGISCHFKDVGVLSTWRQLSSSLPSVFWRLRQCGRVLRAREPASSSVVRRLESWQSPWVADRPFA